MNVLRKFATGRQNAKDIIQLSKMAKVPDFDGRLTGRLVREIATQGLLEIGGDVDGYYVVSNEQDREAAIALLNRRIRDLQKCRNRLRDKGMRLENLTEENTDDSAGMGNGPRFNAIKTGRISCGSDPSGTASVLRKEGPGAGSELYGSDDPEVFEVVWGPNDLATSLSGNGEG